MRGIVLFDPLTEATVFFIVSIVLGVIHVSLGVLLEAYDEFRNGRVFEAVGTQGSTSAGLPVRRRRLRVLDGDGHRGDAA